MLKIFCCCAAHFILKKNRMSDSVDVLGGLKIPSNVFVNETLQENVFPVLEDAISSLVEEVTVSFSFF